MRQKTLCSGPHVRAHLCGPDVPWWWAERSLPPSHSGGRRGILQLDLLLCLAIATWRLASLLRHDAHRHEHGHQGGQHEEDALGEGVLRVHDANVDGEIHRRGPLYPKVPLVAARHVAKAEEDLQQPHNEEARPRRRALVDRGREGEAAAPDQAPEGDPPGAAVHVLILLAA